MVCLLGVEHPFGHLSLRKINAPLKDIAWMVWTGQGFGKGESLRHSGEGMMSARIDAKNRLVNKVDSDVVRVVSCRGHYGEKQELVFFLLTLCRCGEIKKGIRHASTS